MKLGILRALKKAVKNEKHWKKINPILDYANVIHWERKKYLAALEFQKYLSLWKSLNLSLEVINGPFKGLKYPSYDSFGSEIFPKLVGSYEDELHAIIEEIIQSGYQTIIDVGCAEGYYANGFALRSPNTNVFAYDSAEKARQLCQEMSKLNQLENKVNTKSFFDINELKSLKDTGKTLILLDCEGYEYELFNQNENWFTNYDFLIEVHTNVNLEIFDLIQGKLASTHSIEVVSSVDDTIKAINCKLEPLSSLKVVDRLYFIREKRPIQMQWIYATKKP